MKNKNVEKEDETSQETETLKDEKEQKEDVQGVDTDEGQENVAEAGNENGSIEDELAEMKDKYLRLYSEFDNFKRRTAKERLDILNTANSDLIGALLPVLDDFDRARKTFDPSNTDKAVIEGIGLIYDKFRKTL